MDESPLEIVLEFVRAEAAGEPHAFRFAPQAYIVRTPSGGFGSSELPWDGDLLARLAAARTAAQDPALIAGLGELLRRFLAPAGWEQLERPIADAVQRHRPVHLTIRSAAAELYVLPWELLTLRTTGQCLGGLPGVLIRYEWPETATSARKDMSSGPGRILLAWSAAGGAVPAREHVDAIQAAASAGPQGPGGLVVVAHASASRLVAALADAEREDRPIAALHLLCHGGARDGFFGLVLDGDAPDAPPALIDPARLQQILAPHVGHLRLVVLAACDSGNAGELGGRLGSAAQMLHRAGLAAVVASRYPLSVPGSERLTAALYRALLVERAPLQRAFVDARTALAGDPARLDWASVQLYARAADGPALFPILPPPLAPRPRPRALLPALGGLAAVLLAAGTWFALAHDAPPDAPPTERVDLTPAPPPPDPPIAAPPPDTTGTTTSTSTSTTSTTTSTSAPPEPTPTPTTPGKRPKPPTRDPAPTLECPSAVLSAVRASLRDGDGRVVRLGFQVQRDGTVRVHHREPDVVAAAQARLNKGGSASRIKRDARGDLPCQFSDEWALPTD